MGRAPLRSQCQLGAAGPAPSSLSLHPKAAVLGGGEQLASRLPASSPRPAEPASHPVSLSKTVPSASSLGSSAWLCPGHGRQARRLLAPLSRAGRLGSGKSKAAPAEHRHGAYQADGLLSLWWGDWGLFTRLTLPHPACLCSEYSGEGGCTLNRG